MAGRRVKVWVQRLAGRRTLFLQWYDEAGRRTTKSAGTADLAEAEVARADWEYILNHGGPEEPKDRHQWIVFFEAYVEAKAMEVKPRTLEKITGVLSQYSRMMKPKKVDDVTDQSLADYAKRLRRSRSPSTVNGNLAYLRAAFGWAEDMGYLERKPKIRMLKVPKNTQRAKIRIAGQITEKHFEQLLDAAPNADWRLLIEWCYHVGLRRSEVRQVRGEDVDLPNHRLKIRNPKSGNVDEHAILGPDIIQSLDVRWGRKLPEGDLMPGVPRDINKVSKVFREIAKAAEVPGTGKDGFCTLQDLRRNFGTRWAAKVKPQVLIRLMRHSNISTTLGFYADTEDAAHEAMWAGLT